MNMNAPGVGKVAAPLLAVDNVTLQYKTEQHLVTATFRVGFEV
jgi:NitT/TauT family transport system ATP-binding protein